MHEKAPHIPSLMITGPRGVGKKMLVQAICTEVGANMFDLSPANIAEKYPGKAGLNMLLHMVFKVHDFMRCLEIQGKATQHNRKTKQHNTTHPEQLFFKEK